MRQPHLRQLDLNLLAASDVILTTLTLCGDRIYFTESAIPAVDWRKAECSFYDWQTKTPATPRADLSQS